MNKQFKPGRTVVDVRASRIRRDPVREEKELFWRSREWEIRVSILGIILFALALTFLAVGVAEVTSS